METAHSLTLTNVTAKCIPCVRSSAEHGRSGSQMCPHRKNGAMSAKNAPELARERFLVWKRSKTGLPKWTYDPRNPKSACKGFTSPAGITQKSLILQAIDGRWCQFDCRSQPIKKRCTPFVGHPPTGIICRDNTLGPERALPICHSQLLLLEVPASGCWSLL